MKMEKPVFARELPEVERGLGQLTVDTIVAVYSEAGTSEDPSLVLIAAGKVVATPEKGYEPGVGHDYALIAPFDASGRPIPNEFRAYFPATPRFPYSFRFFELGTEPEEQLTES